MAEKIIIPPKFTKEWFSYIWCYYKVHILIAVAVVVLAIFTVYDLASTVKYDLNLSLLTSENVYSHEIENKLSKKIEEHTGDINGNKSSDALVTQLNFSSTSIQGPEMQMAMENKLLALLVTEDEMLFMCDEYMLKKVLNMKMTENAFVPVREWGNDKIADELGYEFAGDKYAASLKNSSILNEIGVNGENLYIMVKMNFNTDDEGINKKFSASCDFAKKVIK